ncbi:fluoride efflux transporter FluC [Nocardia asteroides]|uniref:Fluoride-specific ion channel FluC n=1 Tax=Nocardia asteroides NBRC 15531 TaxID=1110697 RepID=U5E2Y8_NOCAS|nr:CrcB family protein [Nocardia asteroides]TLF70380.1 CrcB family protein [Nocardia asteroides NBRC 15531]UGT49914.1 CrcB family protein [Nocardia asteroides]SFN25480.1 CrcB protein [Nocardia asteroides]VEG37333.1 camphor resistance protein CrcB [Nocardia asteroides]GAD81607.1 protein CrcB homolog [Nocardia asteroides NBRC 15531]
MASRPPALDPAVLAAISVGGGLGATARFGLARLWPVHPGAFPWSTLVVNVSGCFAIGVLMVAVTELWAAPKLVRPFLGIGVLGGFTTFSTFALELRTLIGTGAVGTATAYLGLSLLAGLGAVAVAVFATRWVAGAGQGTT